MPPKLLQSETRQTARPATKPARPATARRRDRSGTPLTGTPSAGPSGAVPSGAGTHVATLPLTIPPLAGPARNAPAPTAPFQIDRLQRVALIEDSPASRKLVAAHLKQERLSIRYASTGKGGLALIRAMNPDLILLDLNLPDMDGFQVAERIKKETAFEHVPLIFLTGENNPSVKVRGFDLGAVDYVTKPFEPRELRARVRASLRTRYLLDLLERRAMVDALTTLWNRAFFDARLRIEIARAQRTRLPLSLVLLDVDHFKSFNDQFGHTFGDDILRGMGGQLLSRCRATDYACRYGGEEFALILPDTDLAGASVLAEDLRSRIGTSALGTCRAGSVTASFGAAALPTGRGVRTASSEQLSRELIERADANLYAAKHLGRNKVVSGPVPFSDTETLGMASDKHDLAIDSLGPDPRQATASTAGAPLIRRAG